MRRISWRLATWGGAGCAALVLASAAQAAGPLPVIGGYASTCTNSTMPCGFLSGKETVLGKYTGVVTGAFAPGTPGCPSASSGCYPATLTTSTGDEVYTWSIFYTKAVDPFTHLYKFVETIDVVGGTGRFAGATGTSFGFGEAAANLSVYYAGIVGSITP